MKKYLYAILVALLLCLLFLELGSRLLATSCSWHYVQLAYYGIPSCQWPGGQALTALWNLLSVVLFVVMAAGLLGYFTLFIVMLALYEAYQRGIATFVQDNRLFILLVPVCLLLLYISNPTMFHGLFSLWLLSL